MKSGKETVLDGKFVAPNWLNVSEYREELKLGKKISFPTNLILRKPVNSPNYFAVWLPDIEDDYREVKTKRRPFEVSTRTNDPRQASLFAISWVKEKQVEVIKKKTTVEDIKGSSLEHYWEIHFANKIESWEGKKSRTKLIRDEKNKWFSTKYGIEKEDWSKIKANEINGYQIEKYMKTLSKGMQPQQKTVLLSLFKLAEKDFTGHHFPSFPRITGTQDKQVKHFELEEWNLLMDTVNDLSSGAARQELSYEEYMTLDFKYFRENQRNWVDLYDAMFVNYFWFLRSQDTQRLRIEWFREDKKNEEYICTNNEPKSGRKIEDTISFNAGSYDFFKKLLKRRKDKSGWLIMPHLLRESEGGQENKVRDDLNFLLKKAVKKCLPDFPMNECDFTTIRHTTFRHHLEADPTLGDQTRIIGFARNGLTSPEMLHKTYLQYISRASDLRKSKDKIEPQYAFVKKISLN